MNGRIASVLAFATTSLTIVSAPAALAHENRQQGDLEMTVGFGTEPAYAGQPNSVQIVLQHGGDPVVDLGDTLEVEVAFGQETMALELEPNFAVGAFGEPGDYRAWFIPTRPGRYTFRFTGAVDGEDVDETFTSGPGTFGDVQNPAEIQFPEQDPTNGELAERIEREVARLGGRIEETANVAGDVERASDDASSAQTFAIVAFGVGALGLALAAGALLSARRRPASP